MFMLFSTIAEHPMLNPQHNRTRAQAMRFRSISSDLLKTQELPEEAPQPPELSIWNSVVASIIMTWRYEDSPFALKRFT
jgi:hypothetical protein